MHTGARIQFCGIFYANTVKHVKMERWVRGVTNETLNNHLVSARTLKNKYLG